ncbi:MAG TPA: M20/M25/M40 family metallo-hydrolase [Candidatus Bathyarchaeia archaeon]|nr:M20/M25/M40 family metallo-hydrolase [Candidatus Bathyarchaeia archaeon]
MNEIKITQELVRIPSYVNEETNEQAIQKWLYRFLEKYCSWLKIKRQKVENNRYNLIATDGWPAKVVFVCHMDTIRPSGKKESMLTPIIKDGKLYGLGAADMKAGIASLLSAVSEIKKTKGLTLIFDCDEEYYFKGIKKILSTYLLKPELVICPEPTNLEITNGCRGLIEIELTILGKSSHASQPETGINAVCEAVEIFKILKNKIKKNDLRELGKTTANLGYLYGGLNNNGSIEVQSNSVPNIAKFILDIRPANPKASAEKVLNQIETIAKERKATLSERKIKLNYQPYLIQKRTLKEFIKFTRAISKKVKFRKDLGKGGFYESALIYQAWNVPAISFGPTGFGHSVDEWVDTESIRITKNIFRRLIEQMVQN